MRIAVVSDVHGNLTALEAVIADLRALAPDLVVHGGDLCSGSRSAEVVDRIRAVGWPGVYGNADEALWDPDKADAHLTGAGLHRMREIVAEQTAFTVSKSDASSTTSNAKRARLSAQAFRPLPGWPRCCARPGISRRYSRP